MYLVQVKISTSANMYYRTDFRQFGEVPAVFVNKRDADEYAETRRKANPSCRFRVVPCSIHYEEPPELPNEIQDILDRVNALDGADRFWGTLLEHDGVTYEVVQAPDLIYTAEVYKQ